MFRAEPARMSRTFCLACCCSRRPALALASCDRLEAAPALAIAAIQANRVATRNPREMRICAWRIA